LESWTALGELEKNLNEVYSGKFWWMNPLYNFYSLLSNKYYNH
jgi:hypothetical protein